MSPLHTPAGSLIKLGAKHIKVYSDIYHIKQLAILNPFANKDFAK